jgi:hypothetical protein
VVDGLARSFRCPGFLTSAWPISSWQYVPRKPFL